MGRQKNDILQGTLALLVLKALHAKGPMHGYGLTTHIHEQSFDLLRVEEGSLYPALHRMEQDGWVRSEWGVTEKGRRARFYALTPAGLEQFDRERESWKRLTKGVALILREV
jgi:PadR family transcriptional regulator, regulatory protein PadR